MKAKLLALAVATPAIFVSCENPADKTTTATVSDAVEKSGATASAGTKYVFTPASQVNFTDSKDFGIVYPGKTDDLIRDEVVIDLKLEAKPEA